MRDRRRCGASTYRPGSGALEYCRGSGASSGPRGSGAPTDCRGCEGPLNGRRLAASRGRRRSGAATARSEPSRSHGSRPANAAGAIAVPPGLLVQQAPSARLNTARPAPPLHTADRSGNEHPGQIFPQGAEHAAAPDAKIGRWAKGPAVTLRETTACPNDPPASPGSPPGSSGPSSWRSWSACWPAAVALWDVNQADSTPVYPNF